MKLEDAVRTVLLARKVREAQIQEVQTRDAQMQELKGADWRRRNHSNEVHYDFNYRKHWFRSNMWEDNGKWNYKVNDKWMDEWVDNDLKLRIRQDDVVHVLEEIYQDGDEDQAYPIGTRPIGIGIVSHIRHAIVYVDFLPNGSSKAVQRRISRYSLAPEWTEEYDALRVRYYDQTECAEIFGMQQAVESFMETTNITRRNFLNV
jgi:hypothetical protein